MKLGKQQLNDIFEAITRARLSPDDFSWSWSTEREGSLEILTHNPSGWFFDFIFAKGEWAAYLVPGLRQTPYGYERTGTWLDILGHLRAWLDVVRADSEAPDLWAAFLNQRDELTAPTRGAENTPFSDTERATVSAEIAALKEYVAGSYQLTEAQLHELTTKLDYLDGASGRLGRIDWWNAFTGAMVTLVLNAIVPPEAIQGVLSMAVRALAGHYGGTLSLPA